VLFSTLRVGFAAVQSAVDGTSCRVGCGYGVEGGEDGFRLRIVGGGVFGIGCQRSAFSFQRGGGVFFVFVEA
jgi:hypothetical protein